MKRSIAILLLLAMILGVFAGCKQTVVEQPTEEPTVAPTGDNVPANAKEDLAAAAEYLKTYYKDALTLTARDYTRLGAVRVGLEEYPITWSVNVPEDVVKIVVNDDGTVTIDIADGIKEETPYVLTATLTDAYGNVETVDFEYTIPASLGTMQEIVDMAYALENGEALEVEATLTGEIISVNTPYDAGYKNVTVTIKVAEREDFPIMCYRLKGEGADTITVGDTITVTGILKNYNGTIEFDAGCVLEEVIKGDLVFELPSDPKEIVDMAYALGVGESIPVKVTLTGKVTDFKETYTEQYKNISVWMTVEGRESKPILVYRVKGDEVAQVAVGDTITVSGSIINYNGTIEFTSGCSLDSRISGGGTPPSDPVSSFWGKVVNPGETYYMYMNIAGTKYYFTGKMDGKYLASSTNPGDAVEVTVEAADEYGRRFYFMDNGTKKYIEIYEYTRDDGKNRGAVSIAEVPTATFYWNSDAHTYVVYGGITGDPYFMGTYGTYTTFSVSSTYYITGNNAANAGVSQYIADFMDPADAPEAPEEPENPETPASTLTFVDEPVVGTAYKFAMQQNGISGKPTLGITGEMSGFYFATTETVSEMVDVYLEEAEGGYHIYFMNGETKTYLDVIPRDTDATKTNVVFQTSGEHSVYTLNTEFKYVVTTVNGTDWYLGTYGTNKTFSASKTSYISDTTTIGVSQFCGWFGTPAEGGSTEPEQPEQPEEPVAPEYTLAESVTAGTAYKFGMVQGNLENKVYYLAGGMNGFYMETTDDVTKAIDVYLEETTGGYYFYTLVDGVKSYINMVVSGTHVNGKYEATASTVYTWDDAKKTVVATVNDTLYWHGTRNDKTYTTMGPVKVSYNGFYGQFYAVSGGSTEPEVPEVNEDEEAAKTVDDLIDAIGTVTKDSEAAIKAARDAYNALTDAQKKLVTKLAVLEDAEKALEELNKPTEPEEPAAGLEEGVAYKIKADNGEGTLWFNGTISSGRFVGTYTESEAASVYVENVTGGFLLYMLDGTTKTYIIIEDKSDGADLDTDAATATVFEWNAEKATAAVADDSNNRAFGCSATSTYANFSAYDLSGSYNWGQYVAVDGGTTEPDPTPDPEPTPNPNLKTATLASAVTATTASTDGEDVTVYTTLDSEIFTVVAHKNGNNNNISFEDGYFRIFKNSNLAKSTTLEITSTKKVVSIKVNYLYTTNEDGSVNYSNVGLNAIVDGVKTEGTEDTTVISEEFVINAYSFVLQGKKNNSKITSIEITYEDSATSDDTTEPTPNPDQEAADAVVVLIDAIGTVTVDSKDAIEAARTAYDALTDAQKAKVTNYETLTAAEAALEELNKPAEPVMSEADFDTLNSTGSSSYTNNLTTTNGWNVTNCAIQVGAATDANPAFTVVGADKTSKAPCLNGKTTAPGKITSPTLTGGISKLVINYTKMFTDTKLGATIKITELSTGNTYTATLSKEAAKDDKYIIWTYEWVLETPVKGDFTIEIVNTCPSGNTGNKDRLTILDLIWYSAV